MISLFVMTCIVGVGCTQQVPLLGPDQRPLWFDTIEACAAAVQLVYKTPDDERPKHVKLMFTCGEEG